MWVLGFGSTDQLGYTYTESEAMLISLSAHIRLFQPSTDYYSDIDPYSSSYASLDTEATVLDLSRMEVQRCSTDKGVLSCGVESAEAPPMFYYYPANAPLAISPLPAVTFGYKAFGDCVPMSLNVVCLAP